MMNELQFERSPHLQKHAHNPINWKPWGHKALDIAKVTNTPIFLSIGYSTCHWCHTMEKESFSDQDVAKILNKNFICIKVDKEERPDLDEAFTKVNQMGGNPGGWPLNVFLTPTAKPYFATTYLPKNSSERRPGMMSIAPQAARVWNENQENVLNDAQEIYAAILESQNVISKESLTVSKAISHWLSLMDKKHLGFGQGTKFPTPHALVFGLQSKNNSLVSHCLKTLESIRYSGLWDHLNGGFMRYCVDTAWTKPNFEKTLSDNALLIWAYTEAYTVSKNPFFKNTAVEIFTFIKQSLKSQDFGFYSGVSATDKSGVEGGGYTFSYSELKAILPNELNWLQNYLNFSPEGNLNEQSDGLNYLFTSQSLSHFAEKHDLNEMEFSARFAIAKAKLNAHLAQKDNLIVDEKVLGHWNALLYAILAHCNKKIPELIDQETLISEIEGLYSTLKFDEKPNHYLLENKAEGLVSLQDYSYWAWCYFELFHLTTNTKFLKKYTLLRAKIDELFTKKDLYCSSLDDKLFIAIQELYDGALPSANGVLIWLDERDSLNNNKKSNLNPAALQIAMQYPYGYAMTALTLIQHSNAAKS